MAFKFDWQRWVNPLNWIQFGYTSWEYDAALNKALDNYGISSVGYSTCDVNGRHIWIGNYPYSYGNIEDSSALPSMKTRRKLRRMIDEMYLKGFTE